MFRGNPCAAGHQTGGAAEAEDRTVSSMSAEEEPVFQRLVERLIDRRERAGFTCFQNMYVHGSGAEVYSNWAVGLGGEGLALFGR